MTQNCVRTNVIKSLAVVLDKLEACEGKSLNVVEYNTEELY